MAAALWRHLTTGLVAHAFTNKTDPQALCGRLAEFTIGSWVEGIGDRRKCKACVKIVEE